MTQPAPRTALVAVSAAAVAVAAWVAIAAGSPSPSPRAAALPRGAIRLALGSPLARVPPVPSGFLGVSLEYSTVERYAGDDPAALDPVFLGLVANLAPGQAPILRIGGDSTDWAWWPVPGLAKPGGVRVSLGRRFAAVLAGVVHSLGARVILGIDLEANSRRLAAREAAALTGALGRDAVAALELGNEPELYGSFAWYRARTGRRVTGRPRGYDMAAFEREFTSVGRALPRGVALAGPASGSLRWMRRLGSFLRGVPRLGLVTLHRYPLQQCYVPRGSARYPTVGHLLSPVASRGLADSVAGDVRLARRRGLVLRIDEMNTISCGAGAVGRSFASALWTLDALFQMVRVGVDGVNIHSYPRAPYALFAFHRTAAGSMPPRQWIAQVYPQYYGMLLFARAAPAGSRLLQVRARLPAGLLAWVTRAPDGTTRLVLIDERRAARVVAVRGASGGWLEALRAPSPSTRSGVTLGQRGYGRWTSSADLAPFPVSARERAGRYVIRVPGYSAVMLTLPAAG